MTRRFVVLLAISLLAVLIVPIPTAMTSEDGRSKKPTASRLAPYGKTPPAPSPEVLQVLRPPVRSWAGAPPVTGTNVSRPPLPGRVIELGGTRPNSAAPDFLGVCGNAVVEPPETCDPPGPPIQQNSCRIDCTYCGDGDINGGGIVELLTNGGFETCTLAGWTVDDLAGGFGSFFASATGGPTPTSGHATAANPIGGACYAVSDTGGPGTHALSQAFTVPPGAGQIRLSFQMFVNDWSGLGPIVNAAGLDHTAVPNQHSRVDLLLPGFGPFDTTAAVVASFYASVDPGASPHAYTSYSIDISPFVTPGSTYRIRFAEVDNQSFQNQGVDNVSVAASVAPPTVDLLTNGDFETGAAAPWVVSTIGIAGPPVPVIAVTPPGGATPVSAHATAPNPTGGAFYAVADMTGPGTTALAQSFTVPINAGQVRVSFQMFVNDWSGTGPIVNAGGLEHTFVPNQHARVDLLRPGFGPFDVTAAAVVANLYLSVDPGASPHGYTAYSIDVTPFVTPGSTYVLRFADTFTQFFLNQGIDNVRVTATVGPSVDLITNGGFETGLFAPWVVNDQAGGSGSFFLSAPGAAPPFSAFGGPTAPNGSGGAFYAIADMNGPGTHGLSQSFTVPANATQSKLYFQMFVNNHFGGGVSVNAAGLDYTAFPNQHARVDLLRPGVPPFDTSAAAVLANFYTGADPGPLPNAYTSYAVDITPYVTPGSTYVVRFAEAVNQFYMHQGVDNVRILADLRAEGCDDGNAIDGDGCSSGCQFGCGTVKSTFPQTVLAATKVLFNWPLPVDVRVVRGDLSLVSSYNLIATSTAPLATSTAAPETPLANKGFYYLWKVDCPLSTYGLPAGRDAALP